MEEVEMLRREIEQLKMTVESMMMEIVQNANNANGGAAGPGQIAIPIIQDEGESTNGRYEIETLTVVEGQGSKTASITFRNQYFRIGGKTYTGAASIASVTLPAIVALKIDITGSTPSTQIVSYASLAALRAEETNKDYYIHPLYKISGNGLLECDFRIGPTSEMGEFEGVPT